MLNIDPKNQNFWRLWGSPWLENPWSFVLYYFRIRQNIKFFILSTYFTIYSMRYFFINIQFYNSNLHHVFLCLGYFYFLQFDICSKMKNKSFLFIVQKNYQFYLSECKVTPLVVSSLINISGIVKIKFKYALVVNLMCIYIAIIE